MLKRAVNLLPQGDSGFEIFWLKRMSGSVHQAAALWAGQEDRLCAAQHEFKEAIRAEPYNHYGYVMHGNSLLLRALHEPMVDRRSTVAIAEGIFRRAQKLYFDHPGVVAGLARVALHRISWGQEPPSKLAKLEAQLKKAYEYDPSYASHPLACLYGLRGDRERRDFYLKRCQQLAQMLPLSWMSLEPGLADITAPT